MNIKNDGKVGIGTGTPSYKLEVNGNAAKKTGGTAWINRSDIRLKNIQGDYTKGLEEISQLHTVRSRYKKSNPRNLPSETNEIGFRRSRSSRSLSRSCK